MNDELLNYFKYKEGLPTRASPGNDEAMNVAKNDMFVGEQEQGQQSWQHLPSRSPLWMVTRQPLINEFVSNLANHREQIESNPDVAYNLVFSRSELEEVRVQYADMIRAGEARLHRLGALVANKLFSADYDLKSVVVGETPSSQTRFEYAQSIHIETLLAETDLDLGNRILSNMALRGLEGFETPRLVANFVEYQPTRMNPLAVHKMISRIKAEEEIWNKVCDEIFSLDDLISRDKDLRQLSHFVKDVFGLKLVVGDASNAAQLQRALQDLRFTDEQLADAGIELGAGHRELKFLEVKDYLTGPQNKQSGWEALKSVVQWWDGVFEIQIQPLSNYFREREMLTRESHAAFKANREHVRNELVQRIPLMGFYRDLLYWLFVAPDTPPPRYNNVDVRVEAN